MKINSSLYNLICDKIGHEGRLISMSKSHYKNHNKNNIVYFNAQIFTHDFKLIWCGDIDITKEYDKLEEIGKDFTFYITPEGYQLDKDGVSLESVKKFG